MRSRDTVMSKPITITSEELSAIRRSVKAAEGHLMWERYGVGKIKRRRSKQYPKWMEAEEILLCQLRWFEGRIPYMLDTPSVMGVFIRALKRNDYGFFGRLGRVLSRKPELFHSENRFTKLEQFLLRHWAKRRDGLPELVFLAPEGLTDVCSVALGKEFTRDALVKLRQRLKLKSFVRAKIFVHRDGDILRYIRVDKNGREFLSTTPPRIRIQFTSTTGSTRTATVENRSTARKRARKPK